MKAKVIKIGNSKGIRLPKALLEQANLGEEVILEASKGTIVIRPTNKPRMTWNLAFKKMAERKDDHLLDTDLTGSSWDKDEWEWK